MKKGMATILVAVMALSTLSGCGDAKASGTPAVKVNNEVITQETIDSNFNQICALYGLEVNEENKASTSAIKNSVVESLINQRVMIQEAEKRKLKADSSKVKELKESVSSQFPSQAEFEKYITEQNKITMDEFDEMAKEQVIYEALLADETKDVKIDAQGYYDQNKAAFYQEETVQASHILVDTEEEAKAIIAELDGGADFAELAKSKSKDGSAAKGGELGYFTKVEMVTEFAEAAFAQEIGTYSKVPVQSQFGFHIIKVTDKKPAAQQTFDEMKDEITKQLTDQEQNKAAQTLLEKLRASATVEYINKELDPAYVPAPDQEGGADQAPVDQQPADQPSADQQPADGQPTE